MSLTTLDDVKTFLGIELSNTDRDALITMFKDSVEASVIEYCEHDFTPQVVTNERNDGGQSDTLVPEGYPIISVQAVKINVQADGSGGDTLDSSAYYHDDSGIFFLWQHTPFRRGAIRVDYTWGYASVPANVKMCVYQAVKAELQRYDANAEHIGSRSKNGESESMGTSVWDDLTGLPKTIVAKLQPYKRLEFPSAHYAQRNI